MAAVINNFEILNNGTQLAISVETVTNNTITSIKLWNVDTFKNDDLSISLNYKLEQINNKEVFILNSNEININSFTDIWFIEVESDYEDSEECESCQNPALGITYNLQPYYRCMLNYMLESNQNLINNLTTTFVSSLTITVNLLIDAIEKSLDLGLYTQAIDLLDNLKKICEISKCKNCEKIKCNSCSKFIQQ